MKQYIYFVSYFFHSELGSGYGNTEIAINRQITSVKMIGDINNFIMDAMKKDGSENPGCAVINYKLLRTEEAPPIKEKKK